MTFNALLSIMALGIAWIVVVLGAGLLLLGALCGLLWCYAHLLASLRDYARFAWIYNWGYWWHQREKGKHPEIAKALEEALKEVQHHCTLAERAKWQESMDICQHLVQQRVRLPLMTKDRWSDTEREMTTEETITELAFELEKRHPRPKFEEPRQPPHDSPRLGTSRSTTSLPTTG